MNKENIECTFIYALLASCYEQEGDNVVHSVKNVEFIRKSTLDLLLSNWQLLAAIVAGIIVFITIFVIFYKCKLFDKVRVNKDELEKERLLAQGGDGAEKVVQVDGEDIELR